MLKRLRVDNFKSLINLVFEPAAVNLLIGPNNSGKTSLCQAMRFLRLTTLGTLVDAAQEATGDAWNLTNAYLRKNVVSIECVCETPIDDGITRFTYTLEFKTGVTAEFAPELTVEFERLEAAGGLFGGGVALIDNRAGEVRLLHEGRLGEGRGDQFVETSAPTGATMLSRLYDLKDNRYANVFKRYLSTWFYYDLEPGQLRSVDAKTAGMVLNVNGSNLSNVLFKLKSIDERRYRNLVKVVHEVEPRLEALNFVPPSQDAIYMSITDDRDKRFSLPAISNGTLRFMAIAYVIMMSSVSAETAGSPGQLAMIEEPENGIYVGHFKRLMEMVEPHADAGPQLIFTSHSPYFIDLFDRYADGVFVMKCGDTHSEIVKPDPGRLETVLKDFSLGEAHYRELLA